MIQQEKKESTTLNNHQQLQERPVRKSNPWTGIYPMGLTPSMLTHSTIHHPTTHQHGPTPQRGTTMRLKNVAKKYKIQGWVGIIGLNGSFGF